MRPLRERFTLGKEEETEFDYIGLHVVKKGDSVIVNQDSYLQALEVPDLTDLRMLKGEELLSEEYQTLFRELVGKIGWMTNTSRPDLCYDKMVLNTQVGKAVVSEKQQQRW